MSTIHLPNLRARSGCVAACLLVIFGLGAIHKAHAVSSQGNIDFGGLLGASFVNQDIGNHVTWGLTTHYNLAPQWNVGFFYNRFTNDTTVLSAGGTKYTTSYNFLAAEANYLFTGDWEGFYVGGKAGWGITSVDLPNVTSKNNFVFGPAVGYDYMFSSNISLGAQANILARTGSPFITATNLLAVLKYNFTP